MRTTRKRKMAGHQCRIHLDPIPREDLAAFLTSFQARWNEGHPMNHGNFEKSSTFSRYP
jgi:hypothetical protein